MTSPHPTDSAEKTPPDTAKIFRKASLDTGWSDKKELSASIFAAVLEDEKNMPALGAFLHGYLSLKKDLGQLKGIDEGLRNLVLVPITNLICQQMVPAKTLRSLTDSLPPFYADILLDLTLRFCAMNGNAFAVEALIDAGADVNRLAARGLFLAAYYGHFDVAYLLVKAGADPILAQTHTKGISADKQTTFATTLLSVVSRIDRDTASARFTHLPKMKIIKKSPSL